MSSTKICTCPSGDGSLRWPCPVHPALPKPAYPAQFNGHGGEQSSHDGYSATQVLDYAAQTVAAQAPGNENKALAALRYYRDECSGHEPSLSVFEKMVDEALSAEVQAEPVAYWLSYSRRAALAERHGKKVTAAFNALVRDAIATYREAIAQQHGYRATQPRSGKGCVSDLELLELAARAAGLPWDQWVVDGDPSWNPLLDDGDALRLAVKLRMPLWFDSDTSVIANQRNCGDSGWRVETGANDQGGYAATRRAIVRAAADMAPAQKREGKTHG